MLSEELVKIPAANCAICGAWRHLDGMLCAWCRDWILNTSVPIWFTDRSGHPPTLAIRCGRLGPVMEKDGPGYL